MKRSLEGGEDEETTSDSTRNSFQLWCGLRVYFDLLGPQQDMPDMLGWKYIFNIPSLLWFISLIFFGYFRQNLVFALLAVIGLGSGILFGFITIPIYVIDKLKGRLKRAVITHIVLLLYSFLRPISYIFFFTGMFTTCPKIL